MNCFKYIIENSLDIYSYTYCLSNFIENGNIGDFIYLNKILFFRNDNKVQLGKPFLENSQIPAKIIQQVKGKKITVLKTKPKKKYTRTRGHRQAYTRVQIDMTN